jgi:CDP-glycerol glycerophosphotransferase (TagB/SpsB family)
VKTLQNKITYYPSTVGGSAISREGSISLANDINHASQFFMDVNWHVKYKSKTDRELLKDCLKYFAEDIDILSSIASSDILIVTTSSVLIDGLVEGKRIIIYNPDQLFNTEHYADLSELPGILIAESLNELLASLAILNVKNIEQEIEINPQSRLFVKYRDRKSSEEMYHAIESDLTFNEE